MTLDWVKMDNLRKIVNISNFNEHVVITFFNFIKLSFRTKQNRQYKYAKLYKKRIKKHKFFKTFSFVVKSKKYKYIIPFGQNCDFSDAFLDYFNFSDSTFYNWVYTKHSDIPIQFEVLKNPQVLFSGGYHYNRMWHCHKTKLLFHGRANDEELKDEFGVYDSKLLDEDFSELRSRVTYLANKTKKYLYSTEKKLITYTILCDKKEEENKQAKKALELYEYLKKENIQNFDFLVICARQNFETINDIIKNENQAVFVRKVKSNYDNKQQRLYKDIIGWAKIFSKFRPQKINKSKYKVLKCYSQI